jgi:hypothetical protein
VFPASYDVKVDFCTRLLALCREKTIKQLKLPQVIENTDMFCVYVNQLLAFEVKLRTEYGYYPARCVVLAECRSGVACSV